jgi:hypothetical protein
MVCEGKVYSVCNEIIECIGFRRTKTSDDEKKTVQGPTWRIGRVARLNFRMNLG